ncbi:hypothetical protein AB0P37_24130 [Streptomyces antimycoticus]|uniref:hypothetical protein n=1 Tax=Streptomyces antimycoticus TaxID=68175 RepID=UPI00343EF6DD
MQDPPPALGRAALRFLGGDGQALVLLDELVAHADGEPFGERGPGGDGPSRKFA